MHPILGKPRLFFMYLVDWTLLASVPAVIFVRANGLRVTESLALIVPLALIYSFFCLFAWYPCRFTPLRSAGFTRLAVTNVVAAAAMSYLWVLIAKGIAALLSLFPTFRGLDQKLVSYAALFDTGLLLYLLSAALFYVLLSLEASREAEKREMEARVLARDAELRALKAQVNPHFLFNSLNSISALTTVDAGRAREMCVTLADFLRRTLGLGEKSVVLLEEELALVRRFVAVERVRFGARLNIEESIAPDALGCLVPPLLLQPLVENAVWHGIANLPEGGCVRLNATCDDTGLSIVIENSFDPESEPARRNGLGLQNVRQRLETRYGAEARLTTASDGDCFRVAVRLPADRKPA
jgi:two-component system, LytTR family, sensor histidine kinase AlgZ